MMETSYEVSRIKWSEKSLLLSEYIKTYTLPQIVKVDEGYLDSNGECYLTSGELLKIYSFHSVKTLLCCRDNGVELRIPVNAHAAVKLKPQNHAIVYQRVSDLASMKLLPKYVEVTRGYINIDDCELSVDVGEVLEIVEISKQTRKKTRSMMFRNAEGVLLKLPFDCAAGFRPLIDNKTHSLSKILLPECLQTFPFYFQFVDGKEMELGILEASSIYDERFVISNSRNDHKDCFLMISQYLPIKVKVAIGTLTRDLYYEKIIQLLTKHEMEDISLKNRLFSGDEPSCRYLNQFIYRITIPINSVGCFHQKDFQSTQLHDDAFGLRDSGFIKEDKVDELEKQDQNISDIYDEDEHLYEVIDDACNAIDYSDLNNEGNDNRSLTDIKEMSVEEMCSVLKSLHMGKHSKTFAENQVDGSLFWELEEDELKDLGLTSFEVKKINFFRQGWRPKFNSS